MGTGAVCLDYRAAWEGFVKMTLAGFNYSQDARGRVLS
jgi:hypothetical protein